MSQLGFCLFLIVGVNLLKLEIFHLMYVLFTPAPPQGTISGPNDFHLLINDLQVGIPYNKYVDDTTVTSSSDDLFDMAMQSSVDHLSNWCGHKEWV